MMFSLDKAGTALIFIEFQEEWIGKKPRLKDFLVKDGELFDQSVRNAAGIIAKARRNDWTIAHAGLELGHDPHYLIFGCGMNKHGLAGAIPKAGTWREQGARFVGPFAPQDREFMVKGRSGASVLKNSTLDPFLRHNGIDTLILMGFATHICVESTLREGHDMGYTCHVVIDACGAFEKAQADYFERHILHHFGGRLTASEILEIL